MNPDQLRVFLEYTRRFEEVASEFPIELRENLSKADRDHIAKQAPVQHALIRYFNLCSEEFYLYTVQLITEEVWQQWWAYMKALLKTPLFKDAWSKVRSRYDSQPAFQSFVDSLQ